MIKVEGTAMIKEGIGGSINDAHDDDFMIEIERPPADRPNRTPQWWQIAHVVSLKPTRSSGQPSSIRTYELTQPWSSARGGRSAGRAGGNLASARSTRDLPGIGGSKLRTS